MRIPQLSGRVQPPASATTPKKDVMAREPDTSNPMTAFEKKVNDLLLAGDFETIETEANVGREKKERFRAGFWKVDSVYNAVSTFYAEYKGQKVSDEMWGNRLDLLRLWQSKMPQSITARVSLATAYISYAWFARGDGFANTVSENDHRVMQERLHLAENELFEAEQNGLYCPAASAKLLFIAMVNGSQDQFESIYEKATKAEPNYMPYYLSKAESLKEKWNGEPGAWQTYVDSLPEKLAAAGSDEIDIIYFVVVADKLDDRSFANNWSMISKERIKNGFDEMERKFTPSKYRLNQLAYISCITRDLETAKTAFAKIGNERNDAVWNEKIFNLMKQLAVSGVPFPNRPETAKNPR